MTESALNDPDYVVCLQPWYRMYLGPLNRIQPCCYQIWPVDKLPDTEELLMAEFNSEGYIRLRQNLLDGTIKGTRCEGCRFISRHYSTELKNDKVRFETYNIIERQVIVDQPPTHISTNLAHLCNLRCIMCPQGGPDSPDWRSFYPTEGFFDMMEAMNWKGVAEFGLAGGEPFASPDGVKALKRFAANPPDKVNLYVNTNGLTLSSFIEEFRALDDVTLNISVDGYGENFEKIRVLGKWARMEDNMRQISALLKEKDPDRFQVILRCVIMKTSLPDMVKLLDLAEELGFKIGFNVVTGPHIDENVFNYPSLLRGLNWRKAIVDATARAKACSRPTLIDTDIDLIEAKFLECEQDPDHKFCEIIDLLERLQPPDEPPQLKEKASSTKDVASYIERLIYLTDALSTQTPDTKLDIITSNLAGLESAFSASSSSVEKQAAAKQLLAVRIVSLEMILDRDPQDKTRRAELGQLYEQNNNMDAAVAAYRQARALGDAPYEMTARLGVLLEGVGELEEALSCYMDLIEVMPEKQNVYEWAAGALSAMGRFAEARDIRMKAFDIQKTRKSARDRIKMIGG